MASVLIPSSSASVSPIGRGKIRAAVLILPVLALVVFLSWTRPIADRPPPANPGPTPAISEETRLAGAIDRARASTVALEYGSGDAGGGRRVASGVVVSDQGDVLSVRVDPPTDRDRSTILARDSAGHSHPARWMAADPETGLTLLRVEAKDIKPIRPSARAAVLGAAVFMIGNPYGMAHSVSRGHVAGLGRHVEIGPRPLGGLIQVQAPVHPGDSGALLADLDGGWLGLVRGGLVASGKGRDDQGFAIPALDALWVADHLRTHQKVDRAYLGIWPAPDVVGTETGAKVADVVPGSPAEAAGLRRGDLVTRLDNQPLQSFDDLTDRLDRTNAHTEMTLEYLRGTTRNQVSLRTVARPTRPVDPTPTPEPPALKPSEAPTAGLLERLEKLEKRVEVLEKREKPAPIP